MIRRKNIGRLFGACIAAIYGPLITIGIRDHWPRVNIVVSALLLGALWWVALYFAGIWIETKKEQTKKLPMSSEELRRRTKEFYERLASHGRH